MHTVTMIGLSPSTVYCAALQATASGNGQNVSGAWGSSKCNTTTTTGKFSCKLISVIMMRILVYEFTVLYCICNTCSVK